MPYKEGGGEKLQPYSKENGEYIRNPQCEEDEKNLVFIKLFGLKTDKPIAFPTFGIHDKDYCELYLSYCVDFKNAYIEKQKITDYLLKPTPINDKSNFFNLLGYNLSNWQKLENQILKGTDFKNKEILFQNRYLKIKTITSIYNYNDSKQYKICCIWEIKNNNAVRFVTAYPKGE